MVEYRTHILPRSRILSIRSNYQIIIPQKIKLQGTIHLRRLIDICSKISKQVIPSNTQDDFIDVFAVEEGEEAGSK